ncbi:MAG: hypothetical protein NTX64_01890 [Elusimicrobia bacterium]|nr:hypothetical protein [Elusimicrobiota bacterium]
MAASFALVLALSAFAAEPRVGVAGPRVGAAEPPKASTGTVKLVEYFLKTQTADLPPERVPEFIAVNRATLPVKLQDRFEVKRMELLALKKNVDGKGKPPLRLLGKDTISTGEECGPPREMTDFGVNMLVSMGWAEIDEEEEKWLLSETSCTECELRTEFTLELVLSPPKKKGGKKLLHFFLNGQDPILNLIAAHRAGLQTTGTHFFGIGSGPKCR